MRLRLGDYELLIRLAAGGSANVFLAREIGGRRSLVALKVILPSLVGVPEAIRMFFTEARLASRLEHPNVVAIAGFGETNGVYGLAMEYVFGASLADILNRANRDSHPLSAGLMLQVSAQICDALDYAHNLTGVSGDPLKLVHRDVTPENVLIGFDGIPKLTDFGIAKALHRGWETQAGILKGKSRYMSPEQLLGKRLDCRSDVFLMGIVLWESLTSRPLFGGSTPMETFRAIAEGPIRVPSQSAPGIPAAVDDIVMRALQRVPSRRFPTAGEMRDAISGLLDAAGLHVEPATIAGELVGLYDDDFRRRAQILRRVIADDEPDASEIAEIMGGSVIDASDLPSESIEAFADIDPSSLLLRRAPVSRIVPPAAVVPARVDGFLESFQTPADARQIMSSGGGTNDMEELFSMESEPAALLDRGAQPEPEPIPEGWQQPRETLDEPSNPFLTISEDAIREGRVPKAYLEYLESTLELAGTKPDHRAGTRSDSDTHEVGEIRNTIALALANSDTVRDSIPNDTRPVLVVDRNVVGTGRTARASAQGEDEVARSLVRTDEIATRGDAPRLMDDEDDGFKPIGRPSGSPSVGARRVPEAPSVIAARRAEREAAQAGGKVMMARAWLVVGGLALFGAGLVVGLFVRG